MFSIGVHLKGVVLESHASSNSNNSRLGKTGSNANVQSEAACCFHSQTEHCRAQPAVHAVDQVHILNMFHKRLGEGNFKCPEITRFLAE